MSNRIFYLTCTILLVAIVAIVRYSNSEENTRKETQAESDSTPIDLRISEISKNSFSLEWETDGLNSGYILYGENPEDLNLVGLDVKGSNKYTNHLVTIIRLKPKTSYYYVVISEEETYLSGGHPFEIQTL